MRNLQKITRGFGVLGHVYLSSLGVVLFSTFNTQGQSLIICPKVTLSDFLQSLQLKFFAEPQSRRLFGVGRVLSCEFRTKDSSLSEYWVSTFSRRDHHIPSPFPIYPNLEIHFACCTSLTTQSFCLLLLVWLFLLACHAVAWLAFSRKELIWSDSDQFHVLMFALFQSVHWTGQCFLISQQPGKVCFCLFQVFLLSLD